MAAHRDIKVNLTKMGDPIAPLDDTRLTELARGVATDKWLVADLDSHRWQQSLLLMLAAARGIPPNVGAVLVPVGPHMGGYWTHNIPAVTLVAQYVPEENLEVLQEKIKTMRAALWPDTVTPD